MQNTPEYERGYKDGTKDCQALYGRILDHICMALDEKGEKEQAKEARKILGEDKNIVVSAHNYEEAKIALENGADYLGVGAIFATQTKDDAQNISMETLNEICQKVDIPVVAIDAELPVDDIDVDIIDRVSALEPYGMANSTPVFAIMEATVQDIMLMGQLKNHCKIIFETSNGTLDAIAWNRPDLFKSIFVGTVVKVAFSLQKNEWQGMVSPQLMIQAIEPLTEEPIKLTTEGLRQMYVIVKQSMRGHSQSLYNVEQDILRRKPADQNNRSALTSIDVFKELGIVEEYTSDDGQLMLRWNAIEGKLDLVTSVTFLTYSV